MKAEFMTLADPGVRIPGYRIRAGIRPGEIQFECHDKSCTWVGDSGDRWRSRSRKDPALLVRSCWKHAERHHGELSNRKIDAERQGICDELGLRPSGYPLPADRRAKVAVATRCGGVEH